MDPLGAFWHLSNFFAPAVGIGLIASLLAKLLWRRDLNPVPLLRLWGWSSTAAALVCVVGLVLLGHDGKVATYAAMVLACALALWWSGFVKR